MATVKPKLRVALLCARFDLTDHGLPFSLHAPIHTLPLPPGHVGRYRPSPLILYAQLEDAVGTFPLSLEVRDEEGFVINPGAPRASVTFPGTAHRAVPLEQVFELDITFPGPGVFFVHLMCNHRSMHEATSPDDWAFPPPRVNVLR
jgi:hypothetical protein